MAYIVKTCVGCNQDFENLPGKNGKVYHKKRYCTRQCWLSRYNKEDREHSVKGAKLGAKTNQQRYRGTTKLPDSKTYIKEDSQLQHRLVATRLLGRELVSGEVIHHEDRNRKNNDPYNLIVFKSNSDHIKHHHNCLNKQQQQCQCDCIRLGELIGGDV